MDYGAIGNGRRLVVSFVETSLTGARLTDIEPPALVVVPNEDVFKSISGLNCPLLEDAHLDECPILLLNTSPNEAAPLFARFPNRGVWIVDTDGDLITVQRLRAPARTVARSET